MPIFTKNTITTYYRAVRISNAFVIAFTFVLLLFGTILYFFFKSPLTLGAIMVIFSFGIVQMGISVYRFFRSFKEYNQALVWMEESPLRLKLNEVPKLERRNKKMNIVRKTEILSLGLFFTLCVVAALMKDQHFMFGSSAVLLIQLAVMFSYDLVRQYHARDYLHQLKKIS